MPSLAELFKHYKDPNALENFKRWFGESKAVDEIGNPTVFYHGSPNKGITEFAQFTPTFFTEDPKYAEMYANKGKKFGEIYPSFLRLERPFDPSNESDIDFYNNKFIPFHKARRLNDDVWPLEKGENIPFQWADQFIRFAKKEKNAGNVDYDSVYVDEGGFDKAAGANAKLSVVPFENNQIKSATKNTGEFDAGSSNIFRSHPIANAIGLTGLGKLLSEGQDVDLRGSINDYLSEGYDPAGLERLTGIAPPTRKGDIAMEALGAMPGPIGTMANGAGLVDMAENADWKKIKKSISNYFK